MLASRANDVIQHLQRITFSPDGRTRPDGALLEHFLVQREENAFEELVRRHGLMVLGVCRRILNNAHDAEDAFQATFLVLVRKAAGFLGRQTVGDWLYGVAYRTALKARAAAVRRQLKERQVSEMPKPDRGGEEDWQELRPLLDRELMRLPAKYRMPVLRCDVEGKTRREAAQELGWPEGTLSSRLARGRALLARRLSGRGVALSAGAAALSLGQGWATASVPRTLVALTVKAATGVVAGQTAMGGAVSAAVAALTQGVLKAMFLDKLKTACLVLLALGLTSAGAVVLVHQALAQKTASNDFREKSSKAAPAPSGEVSGMVHSVDAGKNTITLVISNGKQQELETYEVAGDAKVFMEDGTGGKLGFQEGRLAGLGEGTLVTLRLSLDRKKALGIWAEGSKAWGTVKAVDAGKRTITILIQAGKREMAEKTFVLAGNAVVAVNDGKHKEKGAAPAYELADVPVGAVVTVRLSADQKVVGNILAEGPEVRGSVKSVAGDKNSIVVAVNDGSQELEKSFEVPPGALIRIGDWKSRGKGASPEGNDKLADVPVGANVTLKLSPDQKSVLSVWAEGASYTGTLKAVDAGVSSLTLALPSARKGEPGEDKTFAVAKDVAVRIDGKEAKLSDLPVGAMANVKLSPNQKSVTNIVTEGGSASGSVKAVDAGQGTITLAGGKGGEETLPVGKNARIFIDGKEGRLGDVPVESVAKAKLTVDRQTVVSLWASGPTVTGILKAVDADKNVITVTVTVRKAETADQVFHVTGATRVVTGINGVPLKITDLKGDKTVNLQMSADQKNVLRITVVGE